MDEGIGAVGVTLLDVGRAGNTVTVCRFRARIQEPRTTRGS